MEVSLKEGRARIELEDGNAVTLDALRRLVRDQGFDPREARIVARGKVVERQGRRAFALSGTGESFPLPRELPEGALEVTGTVGHEPGSPLKVASWKEM